MAKNIEINYYNSSGVYETLYPKTLGSQVSGTVSNATNAVNATYAQYLGTVDYSASSFLKNPVLLNSNNTGIISNSYWEYYMNNLYNYNIVWISISGGISSYNFNLNFVNNSDNILASFYDNYGENNLRTSNSAHLIIILFPFKQPGYMIGGIVTGGDSGWIQANSPTAYYSNVSKLRINLKDNSNFPSGTNLKLSSMAF